MNFPEVGARIVALENRIVLGSHKKDDRTISNAVSCICAKADLSSSPRNDFTRGKAMNLKDTIAIVTGGGSGLGEATIREFAGAGARVAILDLAASPGAKVAESLGDKAIFVNADVVSDDQVKDAV